MSVTFNPAKWSPNTKKNYTTAGLLAASGAAAKAISTTTKGKSYAWSKAINTPLKEFAKSDKNFFGAEQLKKFAGDIAKTSGRQKLLTALAVGTAVTVMAVREHFSKKQGVKNENKKLSRELSIKDRQIDAQNKYIDSANDRINALEAELDVKDIEINALNNSIASLDKAAEKLGVDKELAQELLAEIGN